MVGDPVSATRGLDVSAGARGEPHGSAGPRSGVIKATRGVHPTNQLADRTSTALSQGAGVCSDKKNEPSATSLLTLSRSMNVELRPKGNGRLPLEVTVRICVSQLFGPVTVFSNIFAHAFAFLIFPDRSLSSSSVVLLR